jgi:hypothetical protein
MCCQYIFEFFTCRSKSKNTVEVIDLENEFAENQYFHENMDR